MKYASQLQMKKMKSYLQDIAISIINEETGIFEFVLQSYICKINKITKVWKVIFLHILGSYSTAVPTNFSLLDCSFLQIPRCEILTFPRKPEAWVLSDLGYSS